MSVEKALTLFEKPCRRSLHWVSHCHWWIDLFWNGSVSLKHHSILPKMLQFGRIGGKVGGSFRTGRMKWPAQKKHRCKYRTTNDAFVSQSVFSLSWTFMFLLVIDLRHIMVFGFYNKKIKWWVFGAKRRKNDTVVFLFCIEIMQFPDVTFGLWESTERSSLEPCRVFLSKSKVRFVCRQL